MSAQWCLRHFFPIRLLYWWTMLFYHQEKFLLPFIYFLKSSYELIQNNECVTYIFLDTFQGIKRTMWISWHECRASWLTAWVGLGMGKWDAKSGSQAYHVLWIPLHPDPKYSLHEKPGPFLQNPRNLHSSTLLGGAAYTHQSHPFPRVFRNETKANIFHHEVNDDKVCYYNDPPKWARNWIALPSLMNINSIP